MASSSERLAELKQRIKEYEQAIASFQASNGNLRLRRANASPEIREFCTRHIDQNTRTIEAMQKTLEHVKSQVTRESRDPWQDPDRTA